MRRKTAFFVAIGLVMMGAPAAMGQVIIGSHPLVEGEVRYWLPTLDSTIKAEEVGVGTEIDPVDDLGADENETFLEGRVTFQPFRKHKFRVGFVLLSYDGDKRVERTITFEGQDFTGGRKVTSSLDVQYIRAGYEYDFLKFLVGHVGIVLDIKYFDIEAQLKASPEPPLFPDSLDKSESLQVPIPTIGLAVKFAPVRYVSIAVEATGFSIGSAGTLIDGEASITVNPVKYVGISGGYRVFDLHVENGGDEVDFTLTGPFVTGILRF